MDLLNPIIAKLGGKVKMVTGSAKAVAAGESYSFTVSGLKKIYGVFLNSFPYRSGTWSSESSGDAHFSFWDGDGGQLSSLTIHATSSFTNVSNRSGFVFASGNTVTLSTRDDGYNPWERAPSYRIIGE